MPAAAAILALFVAVTGWHYLFYSKSARHLGGIEADAINNRRSRLRKFNGAALVLLATGFYIGFKLEPHAHPWIFITIWFSVLLLVVIAVALAMLDLWLTSRLRRKS